MPFMQLIESSGFRNPIQLHEGACGYSFKAFDPALNREVFVKYYETSDDFNERILSEPRKIAALFADDGKAAEFIASIYSANLKGNENFRYVEMITEFCSGESLYNHLNIQNLCVKGALEFAKQIINGIHVLHAKRIVHRDIKPSNLVISSNKIKIIDLGGASEISIGQDHLTTASKHSIFYRPPEAFPPDCMYGFYSDIYQVGIVLYEMLNGPINADPLHYRVTAVIKSVERRLNMSYDAMASYEQSDAIDLCIKHLANKKTLLPQARTPRFLYDQQLSSIVNSLTHPDIAKRSSTCSDARIKLSSYSGPNWKYIDDNSVFVESHRGRDYSFKEYVNRRSMTVFECMSTKTGEDRWRKNHDIQNWSDFRDHINS